MNDKITFPRLASLLADRSGRSKRFSEDFLREFFALISERLEAGESVKVKGLGTFRLSRVEPRRSVDVTTGQPMEISSHSKVVFVPAKELAEAVNAPFEAFSAVEIDDNADLSLLFSQDEIELHEAEPDDFPADNEAEFAPEPSVSAPLQPQSPAGGPMPAPSSDVLTEETAAADPPADADEDTEETEETETNEDRSAEKPPLHTEDKSVAEPPLQTEDKSAEKPPLQTEEEEADEEIDPKATRRKNWIRTLMISLGAAVIALIATFGIWYIFATNNFKGIFSRTDADASMSPAEGFVVGSSTTTEAIATLRAETEQDTAADTLPATEEPEVPTAPSDPVVYDTISTTRYLTTMAKAHYGNFNLWPYIYEENKAILGHPDRIRPGTPVVIPRLSKYGIDPTNSDDIEKAKKMGVEIYARYGKKI